MRKQEKEIKRPSELNWMLTHNESSRGEPADIRRSGVHEMSDKEIKEHANIIGRMSFVASGVPWTFAFTVNHYRSKGEAVQVIQQNSKKPSFSRYGQSLFYDMFKNW